MQNINTTAELKEAIQLLEIQQLEEASKVKEEFHLLYESLRPINLIKSTLHDTLAMPGLKDNMLNLAIGHTMGFLTRKAYVRGSGNPLKKFAGAALQFGVANIISKNPDGIKSAVVNGIQALIQRFKSGKQSKNEGNKLYYDIE